MASRDHSTATGSSAPTSGHTPGPWSVWPKYKGGFSVETGEYRTSRGGELVICSRSEIEHRAAESLANARLIAAAPDLLEALLNVRGFLDTPVSRRRNAGDSFFEETIASVRAAILKATGGAA